MISNLGREKYRRYRHENTTNENNEETPCPPPSPSSRQHDTNNIPPSPSSPKSYTIPTTKSEAFRTLRLNNSATTREIILQFRILARRYHPDKWNEPKFFSKEEAIEKFKAIANAKELLLD